MSKLINFTQIEGGKKLQESVETVAEASFKVISEKLMINEEGQTEFKFYSNVNEEDVKNTIPAKLVVNGIPYNAPDYFAIDYAAKTVVWLSNNLFKINYDDEVFVEIPVSVDVEA
jgi:hypothetical protein